MKEFDELLHILDTLLAPNGCPWDRAQTMETIRTTVLEEVHELIEAIDENDDAKIVEELGDLFLNAAFFCKLGEKNSRFSTPQVLGLLNEKLIRRHPHIFGDAKISNVHEVLAQWERIKKEEKGNHHRKSELDGIPKELPGLAKAQKTLKRIKKTEFDHPFLNEGGSDPGENEIVQNLLQLVLAASKKNIDIELTLRKALTVLEKEFRTWEAHSE